MGRTISYHAGAHGVCSWRQENAERKAALQLTAHQRTSKAVRALRLTYKGNSRQQEISCRTLHMYACCPEFSQSWPYTRSLWEQRCIYTCTASGWGVCLSV